MRRAREAVAWAAVALVGGCEQPRTELVVRVDSEISWGPGQRSQSVVLSVRRGGASGPLRSVRTTELGTGMERRPLPLYVGVIAVDDDTDTPVWIEALGCNSPNGCTVATAVVAQRAVVRFVRGQTQEVPLLLASACVGVTCASDQRCSAMGTCEAATAAQVTVRPFIGTAPDGAVDAHADRLNVDRTTVIDDAQADIGADAVANDLGPTLDLPAQDTLSSCGALELRCSGVCVFALRDPLNCGDCGVTCPAVVGATATCMGGRCGYACNAGFTDCDERASNGCEVSLLTDHDHCGACGNVCEAAHQCVDGACSPCGAGREWCSGGGCTDLRDNALNCGGCRHACASGHSCVSGTCTSSGTSSGQRSCSPTVGGCGLVEITGGAFTMGEASSFAALASPVQAGVTVGNFALDMFEVTVARFNAFWSVRTASLAMIRSAPIAYPGGQSIAWGAAAQEPIPQNAIYNWSESSTSRDGHPMNGVNYWLAQEFCVWDGGRLPTEAEWEYAARGRAVDALPSNRIYPWGDTPNPSCDRVQMRGCAGSDGGATRRVGSFAATAGLFDMAGNVSEWTADNFGAYATGPSSACGDRTGLRNVLCDNSATGERVLRGGSWWTDSATQRAAARVRRPSTFADIYTGFRCARTRP